MRVWFTLPPFPRNPFLVLVFAATLSEMALRSVLLIRIGKQNDEIIDK